MKTHSLTRLPLLCVHARAAAVGTNVGWVVVNNAQLTLSGKQYEALSLCSRSFLSNCMQSFYRRGSFSSSSPTPFSHIEKSLLAFDRKEEKETGKKLHDQLCHPEEAGT